MEYRIKAKELALGFYLRKIRPPLKLYEDELRSRGETNERKFEYSFENRKGGRTNSHIVCSNCEVYVVYVHDCDVPSPYILRCRRCTVRQHARMLNSRQRPPCMLWDGAHDYDCTV